MIEFHHVSPKKATELIAINNQLTYSNNNKDDSINEEIDYWEKLSDIDQRSVDKDIASEIVVNVIQKFLKYRKFMFKIRQINLKVCFVKIVV